MLNLDRGIFPFLLKRGRLVRCSLCKRIYLKNLLQNYYALIFYICQLKSLILTKITRRDILHYRTGAPPSRLHTYWRGPMRVVNGENSCYTLFDLITKKEKDYHVSDMMPFIFNADLVDPVDVARRDYRNFSLKMQFHTEFIVDTHTRRSIWFR